jgi:hypothetical protein
MPPNAHSDSLRELINSAFEGSFFVVVYRVHEGVQTREKLAASTVVAVIDTDCTCSPRSTKTKENLTTPQFDGEKEFSPNRVNDL